MPDFLAALRSGRVLLMDGAMGTELQKVGLKLEENAATWNVLHPEKVRAVHQAYLAAGAKALLTNTFLINADSYYHEADRQFDWSWYTWERPYELIGASARFRIAAVGPVAGAVTDREFDTFWRFTVPDRCPNYQPHKCIHFPHAILLETCSTPRVRYALRFLRKWYTKPLLLSLTYLRRGSKLMTSSGHAPEWFAERARSYGADALGVNCGLDIGMDEIIEIIRRYRAVSDLPLFARPNAGTPTKKGKRWIYSLTPEAMAERLPELLEAGVSMVGGCCGTTPAHIAAFRPLVAAWNARLSHRPKLP